MIPPDPAAMAQGELIEPDMGDSFKATTSPRSPHFTLRDLLEEQTRDLYDAETEFSSFLSVLETAANSEGLHQSLTDLRSDTLKNIADLEAVCGFLRVSPDGVKCEAMAGLLREVKGTAQEYHGGHVKDAALIANAQRIAHYEIAGFGTARAFSAILELQEIEDLFSEMLDRAAANDKALSKLATGSWLRTGINSLAAEVV
jgi:ferritin-like metal-binding protein YciE